MADGDILAIIQPVGLEVVVGLDYSGLDPIFGGIVDVVFVTDDLQIGFEFERFFNETVTVTDDPFVEAVLAIWGDDSVVVTDAVSFANVFALSVDDVLSVTDVPALSPGGVIIAVDAVAVTDALALEVEKAFSDFVVLGDAAAAEKVLGLEPIDAVGLSDVLAKTFDVVFADGVVMSDSATPAILASFVNGGALAAATQVPVSTSGAVVGDLLILVCPYGKVVPGGTGWTISSFSWSAYTGTYAYKLLDATTDITLSGLSYSYGWAVYRGVTSADQVNFIPAATGAQSHTWPTPHVDCKIQMTACVVQAAADITAAAGFTDRVNLQVGGVFRHEFHDRTAVAAGAVTTTCPSGSTLLLDFELRAVQVPLSIADNVAVADGAIVSDIPDVVITGDAVVMSDTLVAQKLVSFVGGVVQANSSATFTPNWSGYGAQAGDVAIIVNGGASGPPYSPSANYGSAQGWDFDTYPGFHIGAVLFAYQKPLTAGDIASPAALTVNNGYPISVLIYRGIAKMGLRGMVQSNSGSTVTHPGFPKDAQHGGVVAMIMGLTASGTYTPPAGFTARGGGPTATGPRAHAADLLTGYVDDAAITFTNATTSGNLILVLELLRSFDPTAIYEATPSTPMMTSDTTPSPNVANAFNNNGAAYTAFDYNEGNYIDQGYYDGGDGHFYSVADFRVGLFEPTKRRIGKVDVVRNTGFEDINFFYIEGSNDATTADNGIWVKIVAGYQNGGVLLIPRNRWMPFKAHRVAFPQGNTQDTRIALRELKLYKGL